MDLSQESPRLSLPLVSALRTPRLHLRVPEVEDVDWLALYLGQPEIARALTTVAHPYDRADALAWVTRRRSPGAVRIIERNGTPIGGIGIDPDLAYWLVPGQRGRGIATEAAAAMVNWWFEHGAGRAARRLASGHLPDNAASARVLDRLGFRSGPMAPRRCNVSGTEVSVRTTILSRSTWNARRHLPHLTTARTTMRPLDLSDAPRLSEIGSIPEVAPMIYWATIPWPVAAAEDFVRRFAWTGHMGFKLGLCRDGELIGTLGLSLLGEEPEISYFLDPAHWGGGIMAEALNAFLEACQRHFELETVRAEIYDDNLASLSLVRSLGFSDTGLRGTGTTPARLEPAPYSVYRLSRAALETSR